MIDWLIQNVVNNSVFLGVSGAAVMGGLMFLARSVPMMVWERGKSFLMHEVTVRSTETAFHWMVEWLASMEYSKQARRLNLSSKRDFNEYHHAYEEGIPKFLLSPGPGLHWFFYKKKFVMLERVSNDDKPGGKGSSAMVVDTMTIKVFTRDRGFINQMIEDAYQVCVKQTQNTMMVHSHRMSDWLRATRKLKRPLSSVVLQKGIQEEIVSQIENFIDREQWYLQRGIPHRLNYLLYGPPGCGKSSLIAALASHFDRDIAVLHLSAIIDDASLMELMIEAPRDAMLLLEDVDAATVASAVRDGTKKEEPRGITTAGLLNAIDGVASQDGRILFMTTNHRDRIDPALLRHGRADHQVLLGPATHEQAVRLFNNFFPGSILGEKFATKAVGFPVSHLQHHLMTYRDSAVAAANHQIIKENQEESKKNVGSCV